MRSLSLGVNLVELGDGFDTLVEDIQGHILVGRVDGVALQTEAHEDGLHAEDALEGCDDGDATATTYRQRALSEGYCDSLFGCLIGGQVDGAEVGFAAVHRRDLDADVLWSDALDVVDEGLADLVVVLVSYEAARDLSIGLGGKDGLRAFTLIATPDAADVEGRTAAITLERVVADFAEEVIDVEELLVLLFAEGDLRDHRALFIREGHDVIVEVGDGDTPVLVLDLSDELTELVDGVSDSTAEVAGVQVVVGTRDLDLPVGQTAQARGERRRLGADHARVGDDDVLSAEHLEVLTAELLEVRRADLFFTLEEELHIALDETECQSRLEALDLDHRLTLVVVSTACPDVAVTYLGLEGFALPQLKWLGGHDVIVSVDEDRGLGRVLLIVPEDDGVTCRLVDLYRLYTELLEVVTPVLCTALHVGLVLALGADRWDTDELEEVLEEASFVLADIVLDLAHNRYGSKG